MVLNGCRLGFYEPLRKTITSAFYTDPTKQSFGINIFSGAASGILGAAAGSPFFLIKTRLQSYSPFLPVGTQHHYAGAVDGMRQIYRSEGIKGLYRGIGPAMVRTGFGSSVQLPTYFLAKRRLVAMGMEEGMPLHIASSTASGFVVCCVMHPPDTVMSRMYNQTGNLYSGAWDCLSKTVRKEGILAVYKGYFAHLARILPHTVCSEPSHVEDHMRDIELNAVLTYIPDSHAHPCRANEQVHEESGRPDTIARTESDDMSTCTRHCRGYIRQLDFYL
jgi:solute carrier family 25 protein 34/35